MFKKLIQQRNLTPNRHSRNSINRKPIFQSKAYISFEHSEYIDEIPKWKEICPQAEFHAKHQTT